MIIKTLKTIPFSSCKSVFVSKLGSVNALPQYQELDNFISSKNIDNVCTLIVNDQYCSLDELKNKIIKASQGARRYLYVAVNKFYIYSTKDSYEFSDTDDYDSKLVKFCCQVLDQQFVLIKHTVRPDDNGNLGNFVHPVTMMFFEKYVPE